METEAQLAGAFTITFLTALAATPLSIRVARRTAFYDYPEGYKAHRMPTPYLGGAAVLCALVLGALVFAEGHGRFGPVLVGAVGLLIVGTIDDRRSLRPSYRLIATAAAAGTLWINDLGWSIFEAEAANLLFTVLWVVALVNAFNLMDNIDGAMSAVAATSGIGAALLAFSENDPVLAALALSVAGASLGFLRFNLASPARIFLGDGGSMSVGFVLAAAVMSLSLEGGSDWRAVACGALLVGLPIFDTGLVVVSRYRRGATVWRGARDHLTHRLTTWFSSVRSVAIAIALLQMMSCGVALLVLRLDETSATVAAMSYAAVAVLAAVALETACKPALESPSVSVLPPPARQKPGQVPASFAATFPSSGQGLEYQRQPAMTHRRESFRSTRR